MIQKMEGRGHIRGNKTSYVERRHLFLVAMRLMHEPAWTYRNLVYSEMDIMNTLIFCFEFKKVQN